MGAIELAPLREATEAARHDVATVMGECEAFYQVTQGRPAGPQDVEDFFHFEVPGIDPADVRAYGVRADGQVVGLASLLLGWKRPGQSMIGLLVISERHRGRGHARAAYEALVSIARASPHGASMRIGIVETNQPAFGFWEHLGFRETGERKHLDDFVADVVILEKALGD